VPHAVAAAITLLVLAPLAAPGYVLRYDMVFVAHEPLRWDLVAPNGLPRAVPLDTVVGLANLLVPGWLLQRVVLAGALYAAALGAARAVPAQRLPTRVVAAVAYAWTPFVAERLLIGHWAMLVAYAALPWLILSGSELRAGASPRAWGRLSLAAAACAITPTGGVTALVVTIVMTLGGAWRRVAGAVGIVLGLNAPWLIAAFTASAKGQSDPAGVAAFAARGENWSGPVGAVLGTGGIWNAQTTPASRASVLVPVVTLALLALAAIGWPVLRRRWARGDATRLGLLAAGSLLLALLGVIAGTAEALDWAVAHVPGAGLLRDGQKLLAPYALLLAVCVALGVERTVGRLALARGRLVLAAAVALPIVLMPDLALGVAGQLRPVSYPADWDRVDALIAADPGVVLSLPMSEYRAYSWNRGRTVIDPALRYFPAEVIIDDTLYVGTEAIAGEDPRAAAVRADLAAGLPVAATGVRWVLVQPSSGTGGVPASALAGLRPAFVGPDLQLYRNNRATSDDASVEPARRVLVVAGNLAAAIILISASWSLRWRPTPW
jgi:hypothetical protein